MKVLDFFLRPMYTQNMENLIADKQDEIETQYDAYLEAKYEGDKEGAKWHLSMYHQAIKQLNALRCKGKVS